LGGYALPSWIVSTASLIIGVAAAGAAHADILLAGIAGLVAGAMSMAAGEYVSVSSQSDTEKADLELEKKSLNTDFEFEKLELAEIYQDRGLTPELALQVAEQLMSEMSNARPIQAAFSSAGTFVVGAALPLLVAWLTPGPQLILVVALASLFFLALLGGLAARTGGAPVWVGSVRVTFWGALAMALTAGVGRLFGVVA
jgi:VIT1/CCC1 family predicted Fe2+/Mn2+ transporter